MKKLKSIILFLFLIPLFSFGKVYAAEKIDLYDTNIMVNTDGTVDFTDTETRDFGTAQKHGIIKKIITTKTNTDGDTFKISLSDFTVTNAVGKALTFGLEKSSDATSVRVGDADKFVTGINIYRISYKVSGALTYFSEHDEFYWNITGNETDVPIYVSKATVTLPNEVLGKGEVAAECFTGFANSTEKNCTVSVVNNQISVQTTGVLNPGEGLTVAVKFPKGVVQVLEPEKVVPYEMSWIQKIFLGIAILVGSVLWFLWFIFYPIKIFFKWYKERANVKAKERVVAAWFESPETLDKRVLTPAETGALVDKDVDHKDISATIIDLAQRGFIKIKVDDKKDVSIDRIKDYSGEGVVLKFEKELLDGLFSNGSKDSVRIKDLSSSTKFYDQTVSFKKQVSQRLVDEKLFLENPQSTATFYSVISGVAFFTFNFLLGFVALLFGRKSARRTDLGIEKYSEAVSLKNFLVSQDAQINFQSQNQMFFEKLLPYATAFGVEKIWAGRFAELKLVKPDWVEGNVNDVMTYSLISNALNSGIRTNATTVTATRSSSGFSSGFSGGHSGGGGGGGGSSSW